MSGKKFVFVTDNHGDMIDPKASALFKKFVDVWKPDIRIHGGDNWDFRSLRAGASKAEKEESMLRDFDAGMDFLDWYLPDVLLLGNHDQRIYTRATGVTGPVRDLALKIVDEIKWFAKDTGCKVLPYDKRKGVYKLGKLKFLHGFSTGVNSATNMARAYGSCMFGHVHAVNVASVPGAHSGDRATARSVGCLCKLDMDYNRAQINTLAQAHGWGYGIVYPNRTYHAMQAEVVGGRVPVPKNIEVL